ncbi:MAG: alpha-E domain-containing protein [Parvibaculaceae bacterium]
MLSRTAENIFWIGRLVERAENMARLVEMGHRMTMIPATGTGHRSEWQSIVSAAGQVQSFEENYDFFDQRSISAYLIFDNDNPSSIRNCLRQARENARAVRTALTGDMWMAINETWIELRDMRMADVEEEGLQSFLDWIKARTAQFRGATESGALRTDGYDFQRIGTFLERADNMARLLDVKYYVLLPETEAAGGGIDNYQWTTILRAVSSLRAYHHIYKTDYQPWYIADFLILNPQSPRSLMHCYEGIGDHLTRIARRYGHRTVSQSMADATIARLFDQEMSDIFEEGLHEFLTAFVRENNQLAAQLADDFHFGWR